MNPVELKKVLNNKKINYWLFGGYALDLSVGRVTREHKNIDLLVKREDTGKVVSALEDEGFIINYYSDVIRAERGKDKIRVIVITEGKKYYTIPVLNYQIKVPKELMKSKARLMGEEFRKLPNELIHLLMSHSPIESDSIIANNLRISKERLKQIKIKTS